MTRIIIFLTLASMSLSGCGAALKTEYKRPDLNVPTRWSDTASGGNTATVGDTADWPSDFGDPELSRLVKLALERNNDLAAAALRVRQARLTAGLAQDDLFPDLSATGGTDSQKELKRGDWSTTYSTSFAVSYEADLWGKLSRTYDAKKWEAVATEEDRLSTALSLVGDTMKYYWKTAYYNVRLELSRQNIQSSEETLELVLAQERYGASTELEVNEAKQDLASLKAEHQTLVQSRQEAVNALAILFDMPPGKIMADPQVLKVATLPTIPAGLPAQLLGRRPDLRAAEFRLRELLADVDAARASFYPTLTLTGSLGGSSTELSEILQNPIAAFASSIALPFLNWNNLQLKKKKAQAEYDEAVINFRQTLYEAMGDVENALSNRQLLARKDTLLQENLAAARKVEHIYQVRYKTGYGTMKDWLDAQNTRRTAEQSVAENLYARLTNFITLYQALGGAPRQTEAGAETTAASKVQTS